MQNLKTEQEKLDIKKLVLESHLFGIKASFFAVNLFASSLYLILAMLFYKAQLELLLFLFATLIFILMLVFSIDTYRSMQMQKKSISNLQTLMSQS